MTIQEEFERFKKIVDFTRQIRERHNVVKYSFVCLYVYVDFDYGSLDGWIDDIEDECNVRCCTVRNKDECKAEKEIILNFRALGKRAPKMVKEYKKRADKGDMSLLDELKQDEYSLKYELGEWSHGDDELTVMLEGKLPYDSRPKDIMSIQKDTFHECKVTLGGWDDSILDAYHPEYTYFPPQRRMDMFEFRPHEFCTHLAF